MRSSAIHSTGTARFFTAAVLAAIGALACQPLDHSAGELELAWSVEGASGPAVCTQRSIAGWRITLDGPSVGQVDVACQESWTTLFYGLVEGLHTIKVSALDASGAVLASRAESAHVRDAGWHSVRIQLRDSDFDGPAPRADLEVRWSIGGKPDAASCAVHGVASWGIRVQGPDSVQTVVPCGKQWTSGTELFGIVAGVYSVTVQAQDSADKVLAARVKTVKLVADDATIWTVDTDFTPEELEGGAAPTGALEVQWKINGTVDGTEAGPSWDSCAEVGAVQALVTIDGQESAHDCAAAGKMSVSLAQLEAGARTVAVQLVDGAGDALTTKAQGQVSVAGTGGSRFVAEFFFDAFVEPVRSETQGDYRFKTLFAGQSCAAAGAAQRAVLLTLDGTPVVASACDAQNGACIETDGAELGPCIPSFLNQVIAKLRWGLYRLELTGAPAGSDNPCWQTQSGSAPGAVEILVGAGSVNPVVTHDLARISTNGTCAP